jgi:hypothetical protein
MYTIFDYSQGATEPIFQQHYTAKPIAAVDKTVYALKLNYTDPFLKKEYASRVNPGTGRTSSLQIKNTSSSTTTVKTAAVPPKTIKYLGRIVNKKSKTKPVAILSIEGTEYMLKEGETREEVLLLKVLSDSIWIKSDNKKRYVRKEI